MIKVNVPGKLFIIGEYSVTKPGNDALLVAIDKYIKAAIAPAKVSQFSSDLGMFKWLNDEECLPIFDYDVLPHAKAAIYLAQSYLNLLKVEVKNFHLKIQSELADETKRKYGLGSSGAVIIACLKSILMFHQVKFDRMLIFKLAVMAQMWINDLTSGADLAASIYQGWVVYSKYDTLWLMNHKVLTKELLEKPWPLLRIQKLTNVGIQIAVCYSQSQADTKQMVNQVSVKGNGDPWYQTFLAKTQLITNQFIEAIKTNDYPSVKHHLALYRNELLSLANFAQITIENDKMSNIIQTALDLGYAAKSSGAGLDCVISVLPSSEESDWLNTKWKESNFKVLPLKVVDENE